MRGLAVFIATLLLVACSGETAATDPVPTETASTETAKPSRKAEEPPVTAASCIERAKGTGMRAEIARPCHEEACEAGDARACEILRNYDGFAAGRQAENGEDNPEAVAPGDSEQSEF